MHLLDLSRHNVMPKLLTMLTCEDWLSLRLVCKSLNKIISEFLPWNRAFYRPILKENKLMLLSKDCTCLRVLVLSDVPWLRDDHVKQILMRNKKLKKLELRACLSLSASILQVATVQCVELEHILLPGCGWVTARSLEYYVQHNQFIKKAESDPTYKLDPLLVLSEAGLRSKPSERKKSRYTGQDELYQRITDRKEASEIDRKFHRRSKKKIVSELLSLDVSRSHYLSDSIFQIFFQHFNKLKVLNIAKIPGLTDICMKYIAEYLTDLQYLDVSDNHRISDKGIFTVTRYCCEIQSISISGCLGVTPKLVRFLQSHKIKVIGGPSGDIAYTTAAINQQQVIGLGAMNIEQPMLDPAHLDGVLQLQQNHPPHPQQKSVAVSVIQSTSTSSSSTVSLATATASNMSAAKRLHSCINKTFANIMPPPSKNARISKSRTQNAKSSQKFSASHPKDPPTSQSFQETSNRIHQTLQNLNSVENQRSSCTSAGKAWLQQTHGGPPNNGLLNEIPSIDNKACIQDGKVEENTISTDSGGERYSDMD